jgi:hypothetical protein
MVGDIVGDAILRYSGVKYDKAGNRKPEQADSCRFSFNRAAMASDRRQNAGVGYWACTVYVRSDDPTDNAAGIPDIGWMPIPTKAKNKTGQRAIIAHWNEWANANPLRMVQVNHLQGEGEARTAHEAKRIRGARKPADMVPAEVMALDTFRKLPAMDRLIVGAMIGGKTVRQVADMLGVDKMIVQRRILKVRFRIGASTDAA